MSQFRENLWTDRRTYGKMDRPNFIGPLQPRLGVPKFVEKDVRLKIKLTSLNTSECAEINRILNMLGS